MLYVLTGIAGLTEVESIPTELLILCKKSAFSTTSAEEDRDARRLIISVGDS